MSAVMEAVDHTTELYAQNAKKALALHGVTELAISLSDVDFLRWMDSELHLQYVAPRAHELLKRELPYWDFALSDEAYHAHYAKYEGAFFAGPVHQHVKRDWEKDQRVQAMLRTITLARPKRVLDYGCSTGHITRLMAKHLPDTEFVGVDIVPQAVQWFNALAPRNARAVVADRTCDTHSPCAEYPEVGCDFDVIICAEVLEHVIDPYRVLDHLTEWHLAEDGVFLCTLPFGPWESRGWKTEDPYAREHVRHWGGAELRDVFGGDGLMWHVGMPELGHTVTLTGPRVGIVDMTAKLTRYERWVGAR